MNEKHYISGFNCGYVLGQYEPKLITTLLKDITPITSFIEGALSGLKEYEFEKQQIQLKELNQLRNEKDKQRDREI
ncbi:MAG: hypothetical protein ACKVQV_07930 [Bacteroidia bacterium]